MRWSKSHLDFLLDTGPCGSLEKHLHLQNPLITEILPKMPSTPAAKLRRKGKVNHRERRSRLTTQYNYTVIYVELELWERNGLIKLGIICMGISMKRPEADLLQMFLCSTGRQVPLSLFYEAWIEVTCLVAAG
ncbi:uncharacterized protein WM277_011597 [Molossus nigricans]